MLKPFFLLDVASTCTVQIVLLNMLLSILNWKRKTLACAVKTAYTHATYFITVVALITYLEEDEHDCGSMALHQNCKKA